jgi:hypothetical protein
MVGQKLWGQPSLSDSKFAEYVSKPDTYFLLNFGVSHEAQRLLSRALEWNPRKRIRLRQFRSELLMLSSFFVPREDEGGLGIRLVGPIPVTEDLESTYRAYRHFFLRRSKQASEAAIRKAQTLTERPFEEHSPLDLLSPPSAPVGVRANSGAMSNPHAPNIYTEPELAPPSLMPPSPQFNSRRSLESALLQTPPANRALSIPNTDVAVIDALQVPVNLWHGHRTASGRLSVNWSQTNTPVLPGLDTENEVGRRNSSPLGLSKAKKKGFFLGVSGVFRLAGRQQS